MPSTISSTEYEARLDALRHEINIAVHSFYTWLEIHNYAARDEIIRSILNKRDQFWKMQKYALQTTYFVTLRRIFDNNSDTHSIGRFLKQTIENPELFSREAFAARHSKAENGQKAKAETVRLDDDVPKIWGIITLT